MEEAPKQDKIEKKFHDWNNYYEMIEGKSHTNYLEKAIGEYCKEKERALDIGAGNLRDTKFLLDQGFEVVAVDPAPSSALLAEKIQDSKLTMLSQPAGAIDFSDESFDLVNAQEILFHFKKVQLDFVLEKVKKALKPSGVFCASFIGERDDWAALEAKTILNKESLETLLADFSIEVYEEEEHDESKEFAEKKAFYKNDPNYKPKHWHKINVIAVKK